MNQQQTQNRLSEGKTAGLITGKSQHSAFDFFEKIETNFLEKYLLYLVKDEQGSQFLNIDDVIDNNNLTYMYQVSKSFKMSNFMENFSKKLNIVNVNNMNMPSQQKKNTAFMRCFQNETAKQNVEIKPKELLFIYSKFKQTHQKLKDLGNEIQKKILRESEIAKRSQKYQQLLQSGRIPQLSSSERTTQDMKFSSTGNLNIDGKHQKSLTLQSDIEGYRSQRENYNNNNNENTNSLASSSNYLDEQGMNSQNIVNVVIYYTGDVNFRFQNDKFLSSTSFTHNQCTFQLRVHIYYISKVVLFQFFCQQNGLNIQQIDDKTITVFELRRMSLRRRNRALQNQRREEQRMRSSRSDYRTPQNRNSNSQSRKDEQNFDQRGAITPLNNQSDGANFGNIHNNNSSRNSSDKNRSGRSRQGRSITIGLDNTKAIASISVLVGLSVVGAPFLIKKCMKSDFVQQFWNKK